jgi:hypothetical protein
VTEYLLDIASYQGDLTLADVQRAGFSAVNLKISHGVGLRSVHPNLAGYAAGALVRGLGICTFHYLTGENSGAAQATYAYQRLLELGLVDGTAHQADVEAASVTERIVAEYVTTMQALLGRPIIVYTGDWYWASRGWRGSALTPYLWAAPNDGYPGHYPGDTSSAWTAGYGGWSTLAVMQYAVEPLRYPDGTAGTIKVSKSAVRDPQVWAALTGGEPMATSQNGWPVATAGQQDTSTVAGVTFPNGVLRGDVATVLHYVARRFHAEVEPLHAGWCWGWFVKNVAGSTSISNHASGTAIDFNAPAHPLGAAGTFSSTKQAAIHRIIADCDGVVRWGGDYSGRKDEMHFEINKGAAAVKALATRIREGENMDLTPENLDGIALAVAVKLHKDLSDKTTGLYGSLTARNRDAINQFWSDAYHASMNDDIYKAADAGTQQRMRFARDIVRGTVGGPVSEANLQAAIGQVDEEVWAKVPDPDVSVAEKAELLRRFLGAVAAAVGALLAVSA